MTTLRRKITVGAAWMVLAKALERGLGVISMLILARLLVPADFGLVAMATSLLALLEAFTAFAFATALIREQHAVRGHFDSTWTLSIILNTVIATLMVVLAVPLAWFYNEPRVTPIVLLLALACFVQGFENVGVVAFRKELDFKREFLFVMGKKLAGFIPSIPLAIIWESYWALIAGIVIGRIAGVFLSYYVHPFRPRLNLEHWRSLIKFSKWMMIANVIEFLNTRYADFVLGRVVGPNVLGIYVVGTELGHMTTNELGAPINRAVIPGFAKIAHDMSALRTEYLAVLGMTALIVLPAAAGISATAALLVPTLLGDKWGAAIEVVATLAWAGALTTIQGSAFPVFLALNKMWIESVLRGVFALLLLPTLPIMTAKFGLQGAIWTVLAISAITMPACYIVVMRELGLSLGGVVSALWRPVAATAGMYWIVTRFIEWAHGWPTLPTLIAAVLLGVVSYGALFLLVWVASGKPAVRVGRDWALNKRS